MLFRQNCTAPRPRPSPQVTQSPIISVHGFRPTGRTPTESSAHSTSVWERLRTERGAIRGQQHPERGPFAPKCVCNRFKVISTASVCRAGLSRYPAPCAIAWKDVFRGFALFLGQENSSDKLGMTYMPSITFCLFPSWVQNIRVI